jgi:hypothetical protein
MHIVYYLTSFLMKSFCFVAGDCNINLLNHEKHTDTETFIDNIFSHYHFPVISRPTRFCATSSTLINNIFVDSLDDYHSGILIADVSDHLPVFYIPDLKLNAVDVSKFVVKSHVLINSVSIERFTNALFVIDWTDVLLLTDANAA